MSVTCAMRWCCRLMTLDMAICMLPKTATTSNFLSSKDGAPKFWEQIIYCYYQIWRFKTAIKQFLSQCRCTGCYFFNKTHIILLGASPEVDTACIAGDVEHSQALQTRQRHGNTVTLKKDRGRGEEVRKGENTHKNSWFCLAKYSSFWPQAELAVPGSCTSSGPAL